MPKLLAPIHPGEILREDVLKSHDCNWFQIAMLAYNLNCWLQLFNREEGAEIGSMRHTTLATARLRFLFVAAKIWRHAGRVGVSIAITTKTRGSFIA